jgi:hypothetical protein
MADFREINEQFLSYQKYKGVMNNDDINITTATTTTTTTTTTATTTNNNNNDSTSNIVNYRPIFKLLLARTFCIHVNIIVRPLFYKTLIICLLFLGYVYKSVLEGSDYSII